MNRDSRLFWGILLLAIILRVIALDSRSIIYDDAFSIFLSERSLAEIISGTAADTMPPLYYFFLHFWMRIHPSLAWMRLLGVGLSLGGVILFYLLVSRLVNIRAGLWVMFLLAINPLSIYHAQDLRMYALVSFCQLAYLLFFVMIYQADSSIRQRMIAWGGLVVFGTLALYSHNLAIFGIAIPNIYLLFRRQWRLLAQLIGSQAVMAFFFIPWMVYLPGQLQKIQTAFWTPRPGLVEIIQALIMSVGNLPLPPIELIVSLAISLIILILVSVRLWRQRSEVNIGLLLTGAVGLPAMLFIVSYVMRPVFVPRGFLLAIMCYLGLCGIVITITRRTIEKGLLAVLFVAAALIALPHQYGFVEFRSPYGELAAFLAENYRDGDVIIHDNKLSYFPAHFYDRQLPQLFLADEPHSINDNYAPGSQAAMQIFPINDMAESCQGKERVFFITYQQTIAEYEALGYEGHPRVTWLLKSYGRCEQKPFRDLLVFICE